MAADQNEEKKQSGFKVSDRRTFAGVDDGANPEPVPSTRGVSTPTGLGEQAAPAGASPPALDDPGDSDSAGPLPPVDFHTFVLSLGSSALLHLGELDSPEGNNARADLRMAKHTIDIIGMLQEKTRGNLTPPEARLIESLLFDLRLRFVERSKK